MKDSKEFFSGSIGKKECVINRKSFKLLEDILSINGDVYLPIKSFFSLLGYRVIIKGKNIYILQILEEINWIEEKIYFKIKSEDMIEFKSFKLKEPNRLVFDIYNCILIERGEIFPRISGIKTVRYSQNSTEPYVVRIVLEFSKDFLEPKVKSDKGQITLNFSKEEKAEKNSKNELVDIKFIKNEKKLSFNLVFNLPFTYTKGILRDPERIFFDFPNTTVSNTNPILVNENPVEKIRFGFLSLNPKVLRVVFDLYTSSITYEEVFTNTLKIDFSIIDKEEPHEEKRKNRLVIIDPGHGGNDPGAIYSNIFEKDLNLQVSLKLSRVLRESGYNVILLREKDETLSLDDRVNFVKNYLQNNNFIENAIFLSIHANAALSPEVKGIEIFYATDFSFPLAKTISEVLSKYYFVRTLRQGKFYILSRIPIPGVIIEMGFLSNNEERVLITSEEFQNSFVEKIKEAIEKLI